MPRQSLGYGLLGAAVLALAAGGPIGLSLGTLSGQARDAALAIAAEQGALTAAQARLQYRGAWAASTAYAANDAVLQGGALYIASTAFTSGTVFNAANWQVLGDAAGAAALVQQALNAAAPTASTPFTPTLLCGGSAPSAVTYTVQSGALVKIGPVVEFNADIRWSALTCSGAVTIAGLAAAPAAFSPDFPMTGYGVSASSAPYLNVGASGLLTALLSSSTTPSTGDAALTGSQLAATGEMKFSGRYFVN